MFEEFDYDSIKDDELRKEAKAGVEKLLGIVHQPGAMDVSKDGRFETMGIDLQNPDPYPNDEKHKKLRPVYNAIKNESEDGFTSAITQKGKNMRREFIGIYDSAGKPYWIGMGPKNTGAANFPNIPAGCSFIHNHPDGTTFSPIDVKTFIECNMTKMVASIQEKNAAGEIKIHKYILTRKQTGNKLPVNDIIQRYKDAVAKNDNQFSAWKEALNGTCYEISFS